MAKYRKKPVVIEAVILSDYYESTIKKILMFMQQKVELKTSIDEEKFSDYCNIVKKEGIKVHTLEGVMTAKIGDYIIKGVKGEFYPCKPDIFEMTYELVEKEGER